MITRVAVPDDAGAIAEIHVQSWQQAYCGLLPQNVQERPVGELTSIYLRPDAWGRGLGRQLMAHALKMLREADNAEATLWVLQGNARAIHFYEANGWNADGAIKQVMLADVSVTEIRYRTTL